MSNNKTSVSEKNDLTDAWKDLLEEEPAFANKLIQYSYLISGFSSTVNQFHQFIPYEWFNKNRFNSYLKNLNSIKQDLDSNFITQFFKNNYEDKSIIKTVFKSQITAFDKDFLRTGFKAENNLGYFVKYDITEPSTGDVFSRYYRLFGYDTNGDAIYLRSSLLGSRDKKGNKFAEYDLTEGYKSFVPKNAIPSSAYNESLIMEYLNNTDIISPFSETNIINDSVEQQTVENLWFENEQILLATNPDMTFESFNDLVNEMGIEEAEEYIKKCKG